MPDEQPPRPVLFQPHDPDKPPAIHIPRYRLDSIPPIRKMLTNEILERTTSTWAGEGGVGKTYIALAAALAMALGRREFCRESGPADIVPRQRVMYVDAENGEDLLIYRLHALLRGMGYPNPVEAIRDIMERYLLVLDGRDIVLTAQSDWDRLDKEVRAFKPSVLFLDPILALSGAVDINNNGEVRGFIRTRVKPFATKHECSPIMEHHARKRTGHKELDSGSQGIMGARAWVDSVDEAYTFRTIRKTKISVENAKGRIYGPSDTIVLGLDLPKRGTSIEEVSSKISDLGPLNGGAVSKEDAARVRLQQIIEERVREEISVIDEQVAKLADCAIRTARRVRTEAIDKSELVTEKEGKKVFITLPHDGKQGAI